MATTLIYSWVIPGYINFVVGFVLSNNYKWIQVYIFDANFCNTNYQSIKNVKYFRYFFSGVRSNIMYAAYCVKQKKSSPSVLLWFKNERCRRIAITFMQDCFFSLACQRNLHYRRPQWIAIFSLFFASSKSSNPSLSVYIAANVL